MLRAGAPSEAVLKAALPEPPSATIYLKTNLFVPITGWVKSRLAFADPVNDKNYALILPGRMQAFGKVLVSLKQMSPSPYPNMLPNER